MPTDPDKLKKQAPVIVLKSLLMGFEVTLPWDDDEPLILKLNDHDRMIARCQSVDFGFSVFEDEDGMTEAWIFVDITLDNLIAQSRRMDPEYLQSLKSKIVQNSNKG